MQFQQFAIRVEPPQNLRIHAMICMPQMAADTRDLPPFNSGFGHLEFFGDVPGRLAEDIKKSFECGLERTIPFRRPSI